jgi:hypothetical protein
MEDGDRLKRPVRQTGDYEVMTFAAKRIVNDYREANHE